MGKYSKQFKQKCVLEVKKEKGNIKAVAEKKNLKEKELENWVKTKSDLNIVKGNKTIMDRTEFKSNLFKKYKMDIGIKGATNQFTEIAIREFISNNSQILDDHDKLSQKSLEHGITMTNCEIDVLRTQIALNYIVVTNQCFENYLRDTHEVMKRFAVNDFECKKQDESWLECICRILSIDGYKNRDDFVVCEYYRLIRNMCVHDIKKNPPSVPKKGIFKAGEQEIQVNTYENIMYEDYVLFASMSIRLAREIYRSVKLSPKKIIEGMKLLDVYKINSMAEEKWVRKITKIIKEYALFDEEELKREVCKVWQENCGNN